MAHDRPDRPAPAGDPDRAGAGAPATPLGRRSFARAAGSLTFARVRRSRILVVWEVGQVRSAAFRGGSRTCSARTSTRALPAVPLGVRHRPEPAALVQHPGRAGQPRSSATPRQSLAQFLVGAAFYTWREAVIGFVVGALLGLLLATVFVHSRLPERAFVPYVVASQTIPIVALAPMIVVRLRAERHLGRGHRDVPDLLPGDDRDDPRPAVARPARARADALVRGRPLGDLSEGPPARIVAVPVHRPQDRRDRIASWARSSARGRAAIPDGLGRAIINFNQQYITGPEKLWARDPGRRRCWASRSS